MKNRLPAELDRLVREAVENDASDLFLIPGEPPAMRLHGIIRRLEAEPLAAEAVQGWAEESIGSGNLSEIGRQTGRFRRWCGSAGEYNASLCVARSHGDCTITVRIMPSRIFSVEETQMPPAIVEATEQSHGLVVTAGLVGSGKTTAAYALVDHLNATREGCHICTVEEPSHMLIPAKKALVQQREIGIDAPDAIAGIQAAADQDLDVLYVGEAGSGDVLQACISVAEAGRLVITQMHAATPGDTIAGIIELFPEPVREVSRRALARVLRGVSAQMLLRRADGQGRVAAYGVIIPDDEMRRAIADGADFMARRTPWPGNCQSLGEHMQRLLREGVVAEEAVAEALRTLEASSVSESRA